MGIKIDYDNMVKFGCFSFIIAFALLLVGYDLYSRNKLLGSLVYVFISMVIYFYINNVSIKQGASG